MKNRSIPALVISVAVLESGCALFMDKEALYLGSAQNRAHQEDVRQHLGQPLWTKPANGGNSVWVYQIWEPEKGGNNIWTITGSWCDEYVLSFDEHGILRHWTHQSERHRDERSSSECVRDGFRPSS